jgi:hypothetical protein
MTVLLLLQLDGVCVCVFAVLGAAVDQLTSRIKSSVSGLKDKAKPVLDAVGGKKANLLASLLGPFQDTAGAREQPDIH